MISGLFQHNSNVFLEDLFTVNASQTAGTLMLQIHSLAAAGSKLLFGLSRVRLCFFVQSRRFKVELTGRLRGTSSCVLLTGDLLLSSRSQLGGGDLCVKHIWILSDELLSLRLRARTQNTQLWVRHTRD